MSVISLLFAILPEKGHINPYIGPAQALEELGLEVTVTAPGNIAAHILQAGLQFDARLIPEHFDSRPTSGQELVSLIQDSKKLRSWIEKLLLENINAQVGALRKLVRDLRPDALVIDPLYYAAAIVASLEGIPWFSVSNSLNPVIPNDLQSDLLTTVELLSRRRAEIFRHFSMAPVFRCCDIISPYLNIVFSTKEFIGAVPPDVYLVGPSLPLRQRGDEVATVLKVGERPLIYASFGSQIYYWPELFEKLLYVTQILCCDCVLAVGDLFDDPRWKDVPDGCQIFKYAPQRSVLERASVFVSHGGANSVMEALFFGVPMLISPMCNDQFHQAFFVQRTGVGIVRDLRKISVEELKDAIELLLRDKNIQVAMQVIAKSYQQDGARNSAQLILNEIQRESV